MEMVGEKIILLVLAAVGIALLAVIVALVVIILAGIVPWKASWIPRLRRRVQRSVKHSSEFGESPEERPSKP